MTNQNTFVQTVKRIVSEHWGVLFLALFTSIIIAFPQVYFRWEHRDDGIYQGIELLPDSPWSARVREVQDGYLNFGSIYWKEGKDEPYLFQPLGSIVWAYIGKVFSLDINNTFLLSRVLLGFATVIIGYWFVYLISRDKLAALTSIAVVLLADTVLSFAGISRLLHGLSPENFLSIGKPVNNTMVYIPLFLFLISFWKFFRERTWVFGVASAVFLGLNFYNYFYTWTYLFAFGGIFGITLLVRKKWLDALRVASVYFGGLVVAIPYVINLHRVTTHPLYEELSMRIGVVETHGLLPVGGIVIGSILLFLFFFPREDRERYWFGLALLLAPFITLNQQVITGKIMQAGHYHWYFHKPMAVIFGLVTVFYLLSKTRLASYRQLLGLSILTVAVSVGAFIQINSYFTAPVDGGTIAIERQKYGPVMEWLSENADKDDVVMANDEVSHLTVIYTPLNVFSHHAAVATSLEASEDRLLETLFSFYRLRGVIAENVSQVFQEERQYITVHLYHLYFREQMGNVEDMPDLYLEQVINRYLQTLEIPTDDWLRRVWERYQVEYFVWDRASNPDWDFSQVSFVNKEVEFGDVVIYRFPEADKDN